jgi:E-phenylitaconyl-CoA hydratase
MSNAVLVETQGHVTVITLNRPEAHNAVTPEVAKGLQEALLNFREDPEARVAVLTGAGDKAFTAGADLKLMAGRTPQDYLIDWFRTFRDRLPEVWKPVIGAVNGLCYAEGMNILVALTDIRIASDAARFCYAEVLRGHSGAGEAVEWLPRQVPYAIAMEWLLRGKVFGADEALQYGLVNEVVAVDRVKPRALELAREMAQLAPLALRALKESVVRGLSMDLPNAVRLAYTLGVLNRFTEDAAEGPRAFTEKRAPAYTGR